MAKKKEDKKNTQGSVFTTDNTTTGISMPSITQLLNRKRFSKTKSVEPPAPPKKAKKKVEFGQTESKEGVKPPPFFAGAGAPSPLEADDPVMDSPKMEVPVIDADPAPTAPPPVEVALSVEPTGAAEPQVSLGSSATDNSAPMNPKVQPIKKAVVRTKIHPLLNWDLKTLRDSSDPMASALTQLFKDGAISALFLVIGSPGQSGAPIFAASAMIQGADRAGFWNGLKWDPSMVPETWNQFVKEGFAELSPPGTSTNRNSNRNLVRLAFGIHQDEWLLLVRAGPLNQCRGVLAIISKKSLTDYLPKVLDLIQTAPDPNPKAA